MPRRNQPHPSLRKNAPAHGDVYEEPMEDHDEEELEEDPDFAAERRRDEELGRQKDGVDPRLARIEREMELLRRENEDLRRRTPPANAPQPESEPEEPDWDELIFKSPAEAARLIEERAVRKAETNLRREYQQDQGTTQFWNDFYKANEDLQNDDDIVQMVLTNNLAKLGGMPVAAAMEELADLTRKRIMAYSNRKGRRPGERAVAEGASAPSPKRSAPVEIKAVTLSDIIKNRRQNRRKAASAA